MSDTSMQAFRAVDDGRLIGLLVPASFGGFDAYAPHDGARAYVTPKELPLQIAVVTGPQGHRSAAHIHGPLPQRSWPTRHKVVVCVSGAIRVYLSDVAGVPVGSAKLGPGDALMCTEGHQLELLTADARLLEIKQGPYPESQEADRQAILDLASQC